MEKSNSTANTVLIILLVIVVGLVVWYFTAHKAVKPAPADNSAGVQINLGGSSNSAPANNSGY